MTTQNPPSYYFTWVPNPKLFNSVDPVRQFQQTLQSLELATTCWTNWALSPELTVAGNIHYHGYFQLNDKYTYRWYKKALPKLKYRGFVKIDKATIIKEDYMKKDNALLEKILHVSLPIRQLPLSYIPPETPNGDLDSDDDKIIPND